MTAADFWQVSVIAPKAATAPAWEPPAKLQRADPLTQNLGHRWDESLRCRHCDADWWRH